VPDFLMEATRGGRGGGVEKIITPRPVFGGLFFFLFTGKGVGAMFIALDRMMFCEFSMFFKRIGSCAKMALICT
jgi:hypothetical protein